MMKVSVWLLSCSLLTVAAAASVGAEQAPPMMLAGAGGHDSVGGLMSLPLWPPHTVRAQELGPTKSWKHRSRKCSNLPCPRVRN
jgi:hypothetical protein